MQNRYLYSLRIILACVDVICVNVALIVSYFIVGYTTQNFTAGYGKLMLMNNLIWILNANFFHLYHKKTLYDSKILFSLRWKCGFLQLIVLALLIFLNNNTATAYSFLLSFYVLLNIHFICSQLTYKYIEPLLKHRFDFKKPVILMGLDPNSEQFDRFLQKNNTSYTAESFLDQHECVVIDNADMNLSQAQEEIKKAAGHGINEIFIASTSYRIGEIDYLLNEAYNQCIRLRLVPGFSHGFTTSLQGRIFSLGNYAEPFEEMGNRFIKRVFDVVFSLMVIVLVLSWLYPLLAVLIKMQSKGPVLFKQQRSGRHNASFWCYKFRSMKVNDLSNHRQASKDDDRVTPIGRFIRKTSLDELPQFFNVLLGDMSIVGPRPHMIKHTQEYRDVIDKYMARHYLKPGITGWAQVNGFRGETREIHLMEKRVEYDLWYLKNWGFLLDVKIIFYTVANIISGERAAY